MRCKRAKFRYRERKRRSSISGRKSEPLTVRYRESVYDIYFIASSKMCHAWRKYMNGRWELLNVLFISGEKIIPLNLSVCKDINQLIVTTRLMQR